MSCSCRRLDDAFPLLSAQTARFTKGAPRGFQISPQANRVAFLRSVDSMTATLDLWLLEGIDGSPTERLVLRARDCIESDTSLSPAEKARRERLRESGAGITSFSADELLSNFAFALNGQLWICDSSSNAYRVGEFSSVVDPRLNLRGDAVAFTEGSDFIVYSLAAEVELLRLTAESETVTYGLADFIAAEELSRHRGHWWSPSGDALLVERNDEASVATRWLADPTFPEASPRAHRYAQAGTANSSMSLVLVDLTNNQRTDIDWDRSKYEYLGPVSWSAEHPQIGLLSRDQKLLDTFHITQSGLNLLTSTTDTHWVDSEVGTPAFVDGQSLQHQDNDERRELVLNNELLNFGDVTLASVLEFTAERLTISAYREPWALQVLSRCGDGTIQEWSERNGYCTAVAKGEWVVITQHHPDYPLAEYRLVKSGKPIHTFTNLAAQPPVKVKGEYLSVTDSQLPAVIFWPEGHLRGSHKLPVIVHIYGGPHHSEVIASGQTHAAKQWLANQGYCVITLDNRGTPGKGPAWERAVAGDLATGVLADQVAGLTEILDLYKDDLDGERVGITGWSFGGFLSALAVLSRPDVYRAAWAGAPVTDWKLYDTAYTERYLGNPNTSPDTYENSSLAHLAPNLEGELCLVHGLADDNVLAAHSLQLSAALLAAGKPHRFLPLAGVSHMTPQIEIAKNLLLLQREFFDQSIGSFDS